MPKVEDKQIMVASDDLLIIMIAVLIQTGLPMVKAYAHLHLIYEFTSEEQKQSAMGYACSSLEICLSLIQ